MKDLTTAFSLLRSLSVVLLLTVGLVSGPRADQTQRQSLEQIADAVSDFIHEEQGEGQNLQVEVRALDNRLRLAPCEQALLPSWSPGSRRIGRVTVQVACTGSRPWRVHVQASVSLEGDVWILQRAAERGETLDPANLSRRKVRLGTGSHARNALAEPIIDLQPWLGHAFAQRVAAGKVLDQRMLKPAMLVEKGEAVLIRIRSGGLRLQTKGVALAAAAAGKPVQVRNSRSGKVIDAIVVDRGVVLVPQ